MKTRVAALSCALMTVVSLGATGCGFHSRRPLSRSRDHRGPLQLDTPLGHEVTALARPADAGPPHAER